MVFEGVNDIGNSSSDISAELIAAKWGLGREQLDDDTRAGDVQPS